MILYKTLTLARQMSYKPTLDISEISSGEEALGLEAHAYRKAVEYDVYGTKTHFTVRVLTRPTTITGEEYRAIMGDSTGAGAAPLKDFSRFMFKGRIISGGGVPSPHLSLPDPSILSSAATAEEAQCAARIISMHTTFFSNMRPNGPLPDIGHVVTVVLDPGDIGKYNLQYASFTALSAANPTAAMAKRRATLLDIYNQQAGTALPPTVAKIIPPPISSGASTSSNGNTITNNATSDEPILLYYYPGITGRAPVQKEIDALNINSDVIIILAQVHTTPFSRLQKAAKTALAGKTPKEIRLGGWSGGAVGLADALKSGISFDAVIYADPSPSPLMGRGIHTNTKMYYNPSNWGGYPSLAKKLPLLAAEMGTRAHLVSDNHKQIMINSLKELVKPAAQQPNRPAGGYR